MEDDFTKTNELTPEQGERVRKTYLKMMTYSMVEGGVKDIQPEAVGEIVGMLEEDFKILKSYADSPEFERQFSNAKSYMNLARKLLDKKNTSGATKLLMRADGSMEEIRMGYYLKEQPEQEASLKKFLATGQCD